MLCAADWLSEERLIDIAEADLRLERYNRRLKREARFSLFICLPYEECGEQHCRKPGWSSAQVVDAPSIAVQLIRNLSTPSLTNGNRGQVML